MPEAYKPGQRQRQYGQNHQISEDRYAWVVTDAGKFLILVGTEGESGSDVVLFAPRPGKILDFAINLTNLTEPELNALEELFKTAFDWARPVVVQRDKEAENAWNDGDDSYTRSYRSLPTVVYRKRPGPEHGKSVRERLESLSDLSRGTGDEGGVRGAGAELVEPDSQRSQSSDDGTEAD